MSAFSQLYRTQLGFSLFSKIYDKKLLLLLFKIRHTFSSVWEYQENISNLRNLDVL